MNKCPNCNRAKLKQKGDSKEFLCERCGYVHSDEKDACWLEFSDKGVLM